MTNTPLRIDNRTARALRLHSLGLSKTPNGPLDVFGSIRELGFVQLDSIQVVSRAHHHILWSRNQNYREPMLNRALAKHRTDGRQGFCRFFEPAMYLGGKSRGASVTCEKSLQEVNIAPHVA